RARLGERRRWLRRDRSNARDVQETRAREGARCRKRRRHERRMSTNLANLLYLIPIVAFILALRFLSNPAHARRGNQIGAAGVVVRIGVPWHNAGTAAAVAT